MEPIRTELPPRAASTVPPPFTGKELSSGKVLLCDDDWMMVQLMRCLVEGMGLQAIVAEHGQEIAALVERERPILLVMDLSMPRKDGFEVLRELRALAERRIEALPYVIVLSSHESQEIRQRVKDLGGDEYWIKPLNIPFFKRRIAHFCL